MLYYQFRKGYKRNSVLTKTNFLAKGIKLAAITLIKM